MTPKNGLVNSCWQHIRFLIFLEIEYIIDILQRLPTTVWPTIFVFTPPSITGRNRPECRLPQRPSKMRWRNSQINGCGWFFLSGFLVEICIYKYIDMKARAPSKGFVSKTSVNALVKKKNQYLFLFSWWWPCEFTNCSVVLYIPRSGVFLGGQKEYVYFAAFRFYYVASQPARKKKHPTQRRKRFLETNVYIFWWPGCSVLSQART